MNTRKKKEKESDSWSLPGVSGLADRKAGGRSLVERSSTLIDTVTEITVFGRMYSQNDTPSVTV